MTEICSSRRVFIYNDEVFAVRFPIMQEHAAAEPIRMNAISKYIKEGLPKSEDLKKSLIKMGAFPDGHYNMISYYEGLIKDNNKAIEISADPSQRAELNFIIGQLSQKLYDLNIIEKRMLGNSADSRAEEDRLNFLLSLCVTRGIELKHKVWEGYEDFLKSSDVKFVSVARDHFVSWIIGIDQQLIRALARSTYWRTRWATCKVTNTQIFSGAVSEWDKNKVSLCHWSEFYDSVIGYSHPPADEILNDDDKLFEWLQEVKRINKAMESGNKKSRNGETVSVNTPYKVRTRTESFERAK